MPNIQKNRIKHVLGPGQRDVVIEGGGTHDNDRLSKSSVIIFKIHTKMSVNKMTRGQSAC